MSTNIEKDLKALRGEYASLKSDLAEMSETISRLANDGVSEGRERVRSAARQSRKHAKQTVSAIENEIEERPITSLAVVLGVSFLLVKFFTR